MIDPIVGIPPDLVRHPDMVFASATNVWSIPLDKFQPFWEATGGGRGVRIGNVDTGCASHPDIEIAEQKDFTGDGAGDPQSGHGTHTCGTCAGRNGIGTAPEATLFVAKGLGNRGSGSSGGILAADKWLVDEKKCHVITESLGSNQLYEPKQRWLKEVTQRGTVVVAAAGNSGFNGPNSIGYPAKHDECVCVGAYGQNGNPADFSSGGQEIDVCGPGVQIISASNRGGYQAMSGTSMSTPWIAGVIACLLGYAWSLGHGEITARDVLQTVIKAVSDDQGTPGHDQRWGFGTINLAKILAYFDLHISGV